MLRGGAWVGSTRACACACAPAEVVCSSVECAFAVAYAWLMFYGMDMSYDNMYNKFYGSARVRHLTLTLLPPAPHVSPTQRQARAHTASDESLY